MQIRKVGWDILCGELLVRRKQSLSYRVTGDCNFADVSADSCYYDAVLWVVPESITSGTTTTTFSSNSDCTRGQIVTFLYRNLAE